MEPESSSDCSTGIASPVPKPQLEWPRVAKWLLRRLVCCAYTAHVTALAAAIVWDSFGARLQEARIAVRGGFLQNLDMTLRWDRIWIIGCAIGLLIPDSRLPKWLTRILLGGLCGPLAGILCIGVLDSIMAAKAVEKAYAPFVKTELPLGVERPLPGQKFYPSAYRKVFVRGVIAGVTIGTLFGFALTLAGRTKVAAMILVSLVTMALVVDNWSIMATSFEAYVHRQQDAIRHRQQGLRFGEW